MKQSSIEWIKGYLKKFNHINESLALKKAFEKAKQMHKQEIIEAHCDWKRIIDKLPSRSAEEYYKNTYEKELTKQPIKNPIEIGCYICRMDDAYIKMCFGDFCKV